MLYDMASMGVASAPGTGLIALSGATIADGITYLTLAQAGAQNGDVVSYRIRDGANWEIGRGTYTATGTTLSRGPLKSSAGGAAINASATANVFISALAEDFAAIPVTVPNGGTGATTLPNLVPGGGQPATSALMLTALGAATGPLQSGPYLGTWGDSSLAMFNWGTFGPYIDVFMARGTSAAPTATLAGDNLFQLSARGRASAASWASVTNAAINVTALDAFSATAQGTQISFLTTPPTTVAMTSTATIDRRTGLGLNMSAGSYLGGLEAEANWFNVATNWSRGLQIQNDNGYTSYVILTADNNGQPVFTGRAFRGTIAAPTAVQSGDVLALFGGTGHDGTTWTVGNWPRAGMYCFASENWTGTAHGAYLSFFTNTPGTNTTVYPMKIRQGVLVGANTTEDPGDNRIMFTSAGLGSPTASARAVGARIVLWSGSGTGPDYAIGMDGSVLWYGCPATAGHKWYSGATNTLTIDGNGNLTVGGSQACLSWVDRSGSSYTNWLWYAVNGVTRLFNGADRLSVDNTGNVKISGALYVSNNVNATLNVTTYYTNLYAPDGANQQNCIVLGNAANDPQNYYRNNTHTFQNRTYSLTWLSISASGTTFSGSMLVNAGITSTGNITSNGSGGGTIAAQGVNAILTFDDRNGGFTWGWYGGSSIARLWSSTQGDRMTIDNGGSVNIIGNLTVGSGYAINTCQIHVTGSVLSYPCPNTGQFYMSNGTSGYGSMWRNDGGNTYLLVTNNNDGLGNFNGLRPFYMTNSTGDCYFGSNVTIGNNITMAGWFYKANTSANLRTYSDVGYDANINYLVNTVRSWYSGCRSDGLFLTQDQTLGNWAYYADTSRNFTVGAGVWATSYNNSSARNLKFDIAAPSRGALDQVMALKPVQFHWRDTETADMPLHRGFVADEVLQIMGDDFAGYQKETKVGYETRAESLAYHELTAVLWQAVQELTAEVNELKARMH